MVGGGRLFNGRGGRRLGFVAAPWVYRCEAHPEWSGEYDTSVTAQLLAGFSLAFLHVDDSHFGLVELLAIKSVDTPFNLGKLNSTQSVIVLRVRDGLHPKHNV